MKPALIILVLLIISCDPPKSTKVVEPQAPIPPDKPTAVKQKLEAIPEKSAVSIVFEKIKGDYIGEFVAEKFTKKKSPTMKNKIKFSLEKLDAKSGQLSGSSIVAGAKRPFSGSYDFKNDTITATLIEPGDDKYDGVFKISIKADENLIGSWIANDEKLAVSERSFDLEKTNFKYNPKLKVEYPSFMKHLLKYRGEDPEQIKYSGYESEKLNASLKKLNHEDVENMIQEELSLVRNAIYARHGYAFKTRKYRYYFEREVDWYVPFSTDIRKNLTDIEKSNISLLKRYEKHADEYYDTFAR